MNTKNVQTIHIENSSQISFGNVNNTTEIGRDLSWRVMLATVVEGVTDEKVKRAVHSLVKEIEKGDKADERVVKESLNTIWRIAPDIWEVIVDTLSNPLKGLSTVVLKVLQRMREEKESS